MSALNTRPAPARGSQATPTAAGGEVRTRLIQVPMSQQSQLGSHGYDMYPQEFVRLSGCQEHVARPAHASDLNR